MSNYSDASANKKKLTLRTVLEEQRQSLTVEEILKQLEEHKKQQMEEMGEQKKGIDWVLTR